MAPKTLLQYRSSLGQWMVFCRDNDINIHDVSVPNVLNFLQHRLDNSPVGYSSLNTHRAALSLISPHDLGSDPLITRFLKGVFRQRPPRPKYESVWDPKVVLEFCKHSTEASLANISKKLVTLLMLASGQRMQTVHSIELNNIHFSDRGVVITISAFLKTKRPGTMDVVLNLPRFSSEPKLCVPSLLKQYIDLTTPIRGQTKALFITYRPPHGPAAQATLARWVKEILTAAGVDTTIYTPHSVRHASVSKAASSNIPLDTILKSAGWAPGSGMFSRVYNRPICSRTDFPRAVLGDDFRADDGSPGPSGP